MDMPEQQTSNGSEKLLRWMLEEITDERQRLIDIRAEFAEGVAKTHINGQLDALLQVHAWISRIVLLEIRE